MPKSELKTRLNLCRTLLQAVLLSLINAFSNESLRAEVPEMNWEHVYPYPSGNWLNSVAWGTPGFVVVGSEREILFSADGSQWQRITNSAPKGTWFYDVCYSEGKYVAVGQFGALLWSTNGQVWQMVSTGTNIWLKACAGGGGQYVVAAGNNTLLVSTNAEHWQARPAPADFTDMVYGSNRWIAVAGDNRIYSSTDLLNWTLTWSDPIYNPGTSFSTVAFGQGRFVVVGNGSYVFTDARVLHSNDGMNWQSADVGNFSSNLGSIGSPKNCVFANGKFTALTSQALLTSTNGHNWEKTLTPNGSVTLRSIAQSPSGTCVVVGEKGEIIRSDDGFAWEQVTTVQREFIQDIEYAAGRFVAVGGSPYYIGGPSGSAAVFSSTNGNDWNATLTNLFDQLSAVAYGNGMWIVCGDDGGIYTSGDAMNWTNNSLSSTAHDLRELVFGNGRFIAFAASRDLVYHSTNGVNWVSNQTALVSQVTCARFINGRFMAVGNSGTILFSDDGLNWFGTNAPTTDALNTLAYGKGRYVVGSYFSTGYSMNGTNWTIQPAPMQVYDIQFIDGWFVAVGNSYGMMVSRDGINWKSVDDPALTSFALSSMACGNGVVVVGGYLSLYRSAFSDSEVFKQRLRLLAPAQLEFYGASGFEYRIEQSTNFTDWSSFSGWGIGTNQYLLWEAGQFQAPANFWRVIGRPTP